MQSTLASAISSFGERAKRKLSSAVVTGEPEDQLRSPFEDLLSDLAAICNIPRNQIAIVGETRLSELKTRPDFAVTVHGALVGFVELKSPGKGADPRRYTDPHDREQWEKLRSLPNLIYSDGNEYSLWHSGELVDSVVRLVGDIESSGSNLEAPLSLLRITEAFLRWKPIPPRSAKELAHVSARLCRLLRDEVTEQLALGSPTLTSLATDWRRLLFPDATDERFADGYAQAVTFGLLTARAREIDLDDGLQRVAAELSKTSTLIGGALRLITDNAESKATLKTSLGTLTRVLGEVHWPTISKGKPEAWLYFYEDFLEVYNNDLRKQTGSYYTPPAVVRAMVGYVDEVLKSTRYSLAAGVASPSVTIADPATGTGTYILEVLNRIAETVAVDEGPGAVSSAIHASLKRLIAFEIQLGPFAVAQLRILAEVVDLTGAPAKEPLRMYVTNTLGHPDDEESWIPGILKPIADSRKEANRIKRSVPITVVIGNPPYKEKARGLGGWIEGDNEKDKKAPPLANWMPPREWGVGVHSKHLRNLYIYFWRWATWKVFDHHSDHRSGIVCFITVAGFINGPGFQKMRDYLRRTCDDIWVIDCSPEGHQPDVNTRIFQGVQQPVCIVLASRSSMKQVEVPAKVRFRALPESRREEKFKALLECQLLGDGWTDCPQEWRAPFLPASTGAWATYPLLADLFLYNGSGVMPGRTWIIAPDAASLQRRWERLVGAPEAEKENLFQPHLLNGKPGDRHVHRIVKLPLAGFEPRSKSVAEDKSEAMLPIRYAFRSFDRQWILPDNRLINRPNPQLWALRSDRQIYFTIPSDRSPTNGPALTLTSIIPDLHHYNGRGGRVIPVYLDPAAQRPNVPKALIDYLSAVYGLQVDVEALSAYLAATVAHPGYTQRFLRDLATPGLRVPITKDRTLFIEALALGRLSIWLHTFGERMTDPNDGRPHQAPRLPPERMPRIPIQGAISQSIQDMPDRMDYDPQLRRLWVGNGYVENVSKEVWEYEVSGKRVLVSWFSYRKLDRERPIMGDRRPSSALGKIQPDHWLAEYTTELINLLNVLGALVELQPNQADLLEKVCSGPIITHEELRTAGAIVESSAQEPRLKKSAGSELF